MRTAQQMRALSPEIVVDNILSEFEKTAALLVIDLVKRGMK